MAELQRLLNGEEIKLSSHLEKQLETGQIEYNKINDRLFNPLQFIPKVVRKPLLSQRGYRYN